MNNYHFFFLLLLTPAIGKAQNAPKNEAGIVAEIERDAGYYGIQYKRWVKPWLGLQAKATYGRQEDYNTRNLKPLYFNDTILLRDLSTNYKFVNLGIGIDVQRQFYKTLFLYASMNLNGGYGKGQSDTAGTFYYNNEEFPAFASSNKSITLKKAYLNLVPSVGIKFNLKRLVLGTDVSIIQSAMVVESNELHKSTLFDMEIGSFSQRLYIHYRF